MTIPRGSHTVESVFEEVRRQTGLRVEPYAMNLRAKGDAGWEGAPVLQVLDDLCRALGRGRPSPPDLGDDRREEESIPRFQPPVVRIDGDRPPFPSVSHWGPFRAAVEDIVVTEVRSARTASVSVVAHVSVGVQPGVHPLFVGGWEVDEAVDDRGASLRKDPDGRAGSREDPEPGDDTVTAWFRRGRWNLGEGGVRSVPLRLPSPGARRLSKLRLRLRAGFGVRETVRALEVKDFKGAATLAFGGAVVTVTRAETKDREFQLDYEWSGPFRGLPEFLLLDARGCRIHPHGGSSSGSDRPAGTLSTGARGGFLR